MLIAVMHFYKKYAAYCTKVIINHKPQSDTNIRIRATKFTFWTYIYCGTTQWRPIMLHCAQILKQNTTPKQPVLTRSYSFIARKKIHVKNHRILWSTTKREYLHAEIFCNYLSRCI